MPLEDVLRGTAEPLSTRLAKVVKDVVFIMDLNMGILTSS
jgi:hypothetical protein